MAKKKSSENVSVKGMAQSRKKYPSPSCISVPKSLAPIVEAFSIESEEIAKTLLEKAAQAIYSSRDADDWNPVGSREVSDEEIDSVYALMKAIEPKDIIETLYGAQIIVGHLLGMRKLAQSHKEDQHLGLKLLRLSSDALEWLERKRTGGHQNITVSYHNNGPSMQALVNSQTTKE